MRVVLFVLFLSLSSIVSESAEQNSDGPTVSAPSRWSQFIDLLEDIDKSNRVPPQPDMEWRILGACGAACLIIVPFSYCGLLTPDSISAHMSVLVTSMLGYACGDRLKQPASQLKESLMKYVGYGVTKNASKLKATG